MLNSGRNARLKLHKQQKGTWVGTGALFAFDFGAAWEVDGGGDVDAG